MATEPLDRYQISRIREDLDNATSPRSITGIEAWIRTANQHTTALYDEVVRLRAVKAAAYEYADELPADYAKELRERLKNTEPHPAERRARHAN